MSSSPCLNFSEYVIVQSAIVCIVLYILVYINDIKTILMH